MNASGGAPTADAGGLRERLIRTAYLDLAVERCLTIQLEADGLPLVPGHWREQAEQHATAALAPAEGATTTTEWGVRWPDGGVVNFGRDEQAARGTAAQAARTVPGMVVVAQDTHVTPWREVTP